jgi:hypothetical protein
MSVRDVISSQCPVVPRWIASGLHAPKQTVYGDNWNESVEAVAAVIPARLVWIQHHRRLRCLSLTSLFAMLVRKQKCR